MSPRQLESECCTSHFLQNAIDLLLYGDPDTLLTCQIFLTAVSALLPCRFRIAPLNPKGARLAYTYPTNCDLSLFVIQERGSNNFPLPRSLLYLLHQCNRVTRVGVSTDVGITSLYFTGRFHYNGERANLGGVFVGRPSHANLIQKFGPQSWYPLKASRRRTALPAHKCGVSGACRSTFLGPKVGPFDKYS